MTSYQTLLAERRGKTLLVTRNRPDAARGLNGVMARELADVARACDGGATIKAVFSPLPAASSVPVATSRRWQGLASVCRPRSSGLPTTCIGRSRRFRG